MEGCESPTLPAFRMMPTYKSAHFVSTDEMGTFPSGNVQTKSYRPLGTKKRFLGFVLILLVGCAALFEFAIRSGTPLPVLPPEPSPTEKGQQRRQVEASKKITVVASSTVKDIEPSPTVDMSDGDYLVSSSYQTASSVNIIGRSTESTTVNEIVPGTSTLTVPPSQYIATDSTSKTGSSTTPRIASTKPSSAYIQVPTPTSNPTNHNEVGTTLSNSQTRDTTAPTGITASYIDPYILITSEVADSASSSLYYGDTEIAPSLTTSFARFPSVEPSTTSDGSAPTSSYVSPASSSSLNQSDTVAHQLQVKQSYSQLDYFNSMYLAIIVAVLIKVAWIISYASAKMMEPFYELSKSDAPLAQDSLCATYLSSTLSPASFKSLFRSNWTMVLVSTTYLFMALLPPLASEVMKTYPTRWCEPAPGRFQRCTPVWAIDTRIARVLQALLILCAVLACVLILLYRQRKHHVTSNPSTIAYVASLLQDQGVLSDFRQLNPSASKHVLGQELADHRYGLRFDADRGGHYLFQTSTERLQEVPTASSAVIVPYYQHGYQPVNATHQVPSARANHKYRSIWDLWHLVLTLGFLSVIVAYFLESRDTAFNRFFSSTGFGPRFVLAIVATIVDSHWKSLEREVRIVTPYRRLARGNAHAEDTVLATMHGTPYTSIGSALWRRNWFHAFIALVAIFSDILIISVAGVPYSDAQFYLALLVSSYVSFGILGIMIVALVAVIIWRRGNAKLALPRPPSTVLAVALTMCGDNDSLRRNAATILEESRSTGGRSLLDKGEQPTYSAGWIKEWDGRERWTIIEDRPAGDHWS